MESLAALAADALAIFFGFLLAVYIRFYTGWIPMFHDRVPAIEIYIYGSGVATLLFLFIFRSLGLYARPQTGSFSDKIPRLLRAIGWGILLAVALAFIIRTEPPFSRITAFLSFFTVAALVLIERYVLFNIELDIARRRQTVNRVVIIGTDVVAAHLKQVLEHEPRLRSRVTAFLQTDNEPPDRGVPVELIKGTAKDLEDLIEKGEVDRVILADTSLPHKRMVQIILACERGLVPFQLIPDLFGVLTSRVSVEHVGDVPLIGFSKWPLARFWHRAFKRAEDIAGSRAFLTRPGILPAGALRRGRPGVYHL